MKAFDFIFGQRPVSPVGRRKLVAADNNTPFLVSRRQCGENDGAQRNGGTTTMRNKSPKLNCFTCPEDNNRYDGATDNIFGRVWRARIIIIRLPLRANSRAGEGGGGGNYRAGPSRSLHTNGYISSRSVYRSIINCRLSTTLCGMSMGLTRRRRSSRIESRPLNPKSENNPPLLRQPLLSL